jgi:60 kDa SS-A/Ro ribonucleoprotein
MGISAKNIVLGLTATDFTIADPNDPNSLDVVGFDSAVPQIIGEFVIGKI